MSSVPLLPLKCPTSATLLASMGRPEHRCLVGEVMANEKKQSCLSVCCEDKAASAVAPPNSQPRERLPGKGQSWNMRGVGSSPARRRTLPHHDRFPRTEDRHAASQAVLTLTLPSHSILANALLTCVAKCGILPASLMSQPAAGWRPAVQDTVSQGERLTPHPILIPSRELHAGARGSLLRARSRSGGWAPASAPPERPAATPPRAAPVPQELLVQSKPGKT